LRAAIEWSYDLLDEGEKQLFRRVAVFVGGLTLEAIEAVCNMEGDLSIDVLDGTESLVSKSLLRQAEGVDREPRFVMLETICEFAREELEASGEEEELRRRHAEYFLALAEEAEPRLHGPNQLEWLGLLEEEHDNLRAALNWAQESDHVDMVLRLVGSLWSFWNLHSHFTEGRERISSALLSEQPNLSMPGAAKALYGAGFLAWKQGDNAAAQSLFRTSLALFRERGDKLGLAMSLSSLARAVRNEQDDISSQLMSEESLALAREVGDKAVISFALTGLGHLAVARGDYDQARSLYEESLAMRREMGDQYSISISLNNMGNVALNQGDYARARSLLEESLAIHRELGEKQAIAVSVVGLGGVAAGMGQAERGARVLGAAGALLEAIHANLAPEDRILYEQGVAAARAQMSEEEFEKAWAEGRAMSMEQAVEYALEDSDE
jgi:tetratricopeptide (TPR) repeat protein